MSQSESTTQNASTATNQTVAVVPTGIAGNPYYFQDEERFAERVMSELRAFAPVIGSVGEVIVRGSYELAQVLDEHTSDALEVDSYSMDFRMVLDDEGDDNVRSVIGDGEPIVNFVDEVHGLSDERRANFDLRDYDDRDLINGEVLNKLEEVGDEGEGPSEGEKRIGRAKAKSKARATEMLVDDFYDYVDTADHAVILEDGSQDYEDAASDVRGHHNWSASPSSCEGQVLSITLDGGEDGALNWTHALLSRDVISEDELSESQLARLRETLDEDTFNALLEADYEVNTESTESTEPAAEPGQGSRPTGEAAAIAGNPADD